MSFVSELKRRNVFRAAFAMPWWLLVQIAGLLLDAMVELGLTLAEQGRIREAETVFIEGGIAST